MPDNDIDFKQAMAGIRQLKQDKNAPTPVRKHFIKNTSLEVGNETANFVGATENEPGAKTLFFARGGLQGRTLRELKQSRHFHSQSILDLHGYRLKQAEVELQQFIASSVNRGTRHILIIHGKGLHNTGGHSSLKAFAADWLKHCSHVLAYVSAQAQDGGNGALYVLLKKPRPNSSINP